ncbi:hypothetical protein TNCV_4955831 [Trichonephila clavipes]|nr:hypothetical protein TNCV_4955831 [Trichonephila clavipes]
MPHILGGVLDAIDLLLVLHVPGTSNALISFSGATCNRLCMRCRWLQRRISGHGSSLQLISPGQLAAPSCLNAHDNPSNVSVGCAMTYAAATSNNPCDNR